MEMGNVFAEVNTKLYFCQLLILNYFADFAGILPHCRSSAAKQT